MSKRTRMSAQLDFINQTLGAETKPRVLSELKAIGFKGRITPRYNLPFSYFWKSNWTIIMFCIIFSPAWFIPEARIFILMPYLWLFIGILYSRIYGGTEDHLDIGLNASTYVTVLVLICAFAFLVGEQLIGITGIILSVLISIVGGFWVAFWTFLLPCVFIPFGVSQFLSRIAGHFLGIGIHKPLE